MMAAHYALVPLREVLLLWLLIFLLLPSLLLLVVVLLLAVLILVDDVTGGLHTALPLTTPYRYHGSSCCSYSCSCGGLRTALALDTRSNMLAAEYTQRLLLVVVVLHAVLILVDDVNGGLHTALPVTKTYRYHSSSCCSYSCSCGGLRTALALDTRSNMIAAEYTQRLRQLKGQNKPIRNSAPKRILRDRCANFRNDGG